MDLSKKPVWPDRLMLWLCKERYAEDILGDLEEYFSHLHEQKKNFKTLRYWYQSFQFLRPFALKIPFKNSNATTMFKMNLKIAFRNLTRHKLYSFINILGLALGITTCLFIEMFIKDEMSYDKHWENYDQIYRIVDHLKFQDNEWHLATTPAPMASAFKADFPEIKEACKMRDLGSEILEVEKNLTKIDQWAYANQKAFDIFSFAVLEGSLNVRQGIYYPNKKQVQGDHP